MGTTEPAPWGQRREPPELPALGTQVGAYRLEKRLGDGGMGHVYAAFDPSLERRVAIKFLHRRLLGDERSAQRFLREGRSLGAIAHGSVVRIFAVGDHAEWPYLVMEFVDGTPLSRVLRSGRLPIAEVLRIAQELADALAAVHGHRIAHRDVNPSNVLLRNRDGSVCLIDFGLARALEVRVETSSAVAGTPHYMAPEQVAGRPQDLRVDVYSFGVTLFEMLVGKTPNDSEESGSFFHSVLHRDAPLVRTLRPDAPDGVEELLARALSRSPELRQQDGRVLAAEMRELRSRAREREPAEQVEEEPIPLPAPPSDPGEELPLVGRDVEFAAAGAALAELRRRRGGVVLVEGGPGAGKSRFVRDVERAASSLGLTSLRCDATVRRAEPYAAIRIALSCDAARARAPDGLCALVAEFSPGSEPLLPALAWLVETTIPGAGERPPERAAIVQAAIVALRCLVRERPSLLVVDDVHLADEGSLEVLVALADQAASMPLALLLSHAVATTLPEGAPFAPLLPRLRAAASSTSIPLPPLSEAAVARTIFVALRVSETEACRLAPMLHRRSAGNPLYLTEALRLIDQEGFVGESAGGGRTIRARLSTLEIPPRMLELALRRISGLPADERETLGVVSLDEAGVTAEVIARCRDVPRLSVLRVLQQLVRARGLVRQDGDAYVVDHAEIREAVYGELIPELRAAWHERIAQSMEEAGAGHGEPARLGRHLQRAGRRAEAFAPLLDAGRRALAGHAPAEALEVLDAALACADDARRAEAQVERSLALEVLGELDAARAALEPVILGSGGIATEARLRLARFERNRGRDAEAWSLLEDADSAELPSEMRARIAAQQATLASRMGRRDQALAAIARAAAFAVGAPRHTELEVTETLGLVHYRLGRYDEARPAFERTIVLAEELGVTASVAVGLHNMALVFSDLGDPQAALAWAERAVERAAVIGNERVLAFALLHVVELLTAALRLDDADVQLRRAEEAVERLDNDEARYALLAHGAELDLARTRPEAAISRLDRALVLAERHPTNLAGIEILRAEALLGLDRPREALDAARHARTTFESAGIVEDAETALAFAARALRVLGRDEAERAELRAKTEVSSFQAALERAADTEGPMRAQWFRRAAALAVDERSRRLVADLRA